MDKRVGRRRGKAGNRKRWQAKAAVRGITRLGTSGPNLAHRVMETGLTIGLQVPVLVVALLASGQVLVGGLMVQEDLVSDGADLARLAMEVLDFMEAAADLDLDLVEAVVVVVSIFKMILVAAKLKDHLAKPGQTGLAVDWVGTID